MILTDTEISECLTGGPKTVARMVEAAVLNKLAQGVDMPEAKFAYEKATDGVQGTHFYEVINPKAVPIWAALFTADQLRTVAAAARAKALEDAATLLEKNADDCSLVLEANVLMANATAIRPLKGAA